jgi:hypothetical protein
MKIKLLNPCATFVASLTLQQKRTKKKDIRATMVQFSQTKGTEDNL